MYYVALIWNEVDAERTRTARQLLARFNMVSKDWQTVVDQPGLAVCCRPRPGGRLDEVYVLPGGRGAVLGKIFESKDLDDSGSTSATPTPARLNESRSAALIASRGAELVTHYWGQYAAFLRHGESRRSWVVRDPSGGVPCQWTHVLGIDVYFARLDDCERLAPLALSIDRRYLVGYLLYSSTCRRETPFNEVQTVLPGERIEHRSDARSHSFVWNALEVARRDVIEDEAEAVRLTRHTVRSCVHAWASCFDGILHSLSGGLDSSIVAACLADAPTKPRVLCRNYYLAGPNSDERTLARLVAQRTGFELIEREAQTAFDARSMRHFVRSVLPVCWPVDEDEDRRENRFLESRGLSAEFRGHGGDELFFRGGSFHTAVDYAWRHALRPALISIALDDAALDRASLWQILRRAYRYGIRKRPWQLRSNVPSDHMPLMDASIKQEARRDPALWHPLFQSSAGMPPGKFEHAYLLTYGTCKVYDPLMPDDAPARFSPLISQPMIELSLRTPLYVLRAGGRDRSVARRAFAADLPPEIIRRKAKAFGTHQYRIIIESNVDVVRELLLDGLLAREGILDRTRLEEVLSPRVSRIPAQISELCDYLSLEAWMRSWADSEPAVRSTSHRDALRYGAGT